MKSTIIQSLRIEPLTLPLVCPFRTALGQHDLLDNLLCTITLENGKKGYGEAAIATHITGETIAQTTKSLEAARSMLEGKDAATYLALSRHLHEAFPRNKAALAALEMAILDAWTRSCHLPLWKLFGTKVVPITSDITLVISSVEETIDATRAYMKQGFRTFKIKVGRDHDLDVARICAIKKIAPHARLYLDANQGYSAEETLRLIRSVKKYATIALLEQPVPKADWEGLKKVTRSAGIPVCADESVSSMNELSRAIREKAVHAINIKVMKSGLIEARELAYAAHAAGLGIMIGGMMESSLAMTASAHIAAGTGICTYVDLDTPFFIVGEAQRNAYLSSRGVYDVSGVSSGIGIIPRKRR